MGSLSTANTEFCFDVFKELSCNNVGDNIFFSPLSLLYALSMILLGARGNSAEQVKKVRNGIATPQILEVFQVPYLVCQITPIFIKRKLPFCGRKKHF
jgi:serine protease inhibitor